MTQQRNQVASFFNKYGPFVYRRARYLVGNHEDAEEATQEVFIRALKGIEKFDEQCSIHTWLSRITTNYCFNLLRDKKRRKELWDEKEEELIDWSTTPGLSPEEKITVKKIVAETDEITAKAVVCVLIDGMSHKEASEILGVSRRTVGNILDRFAKWAEKRITA